MAKYPQALSSLITLLKKLPGVGNATSERYAFNLLKWSDSQLVSLGELLINLKKSVEICPTCGCLKESVCLFCNLTERRSDTICIVSSPKDAFIFDSSCSYNGLYHVVQHLLSPLMGQTHEGLRLEQLKKRIKELNVKEVIIALDSTLEGDSTSLFIKNHIENESIKISRLAFGMPLGSTLEYVDGGTLSKALSGRQKF